MSYKGHRAVIMKNIVFSIPMYHTLGYYAQSCDITGKCEYDNDL